jgi:predicted dehydrogenase
MSLYEKERWMPTKPNRRDFLKSSALAGAGMMMAGRSVNAQNKSPNEKLNIATVGAGGMAGSDIHQLQSECGDLINFVAFADVDHKQAAGTFKKYPKAKKYYDFRKMLDENHKDIDAVLVATPDHCHAVAAMAAMQLGKHVYVEKPLTHNVFEARKLREAAHKYNVVTQMGNQGTNNNGLRHGVEVIQSGAIGPVREVHVWTNRPVWPQGVDAMLKNHSVHKAMTGQGGPAPKPRDNFRWDLWQGPAKERPFDNCFFPFVWRGWWDYGTGALGDMACHTANLPFWACKLGAPRSLRAQVASDMNEFSFPSWSVIDYEFPARDGLPPVQYTWYDGGGKKPQWMIDKLAGMLHGEPLPGSGFLIVGDDGAMFSSSDYGGSWKLLPERKFRDYTPPPQKMPKGEGHRKEWVLGCLGGPKPMSNFDYAGPLTEMVLLGCVAMRVPGNTIEWDAPNMKIPNMPEAEQYLKREYRKGWSL